MNGQHTMRRALTQVEAIISLAICAMLLTAVGAAFSSSASLVEQNDQFFRAANAARVSVHQLMGEVRRAKALQVSSDRIDMIASDDHDRTYRFVKLAGDATGKLMLITNDDETDPDYVLADNIADLSFSADTKCVSMSVTVVVEKNQVTLHGSAMQRRLVTYK